MCFSLNHIYIRIKYIYDMIYIFYTIVSLPYHMLFIATSYVSYYSDSRITHFRTNDYNSKFLKIHQ